MSDTTLMKAARIVDTVGNALILQLSFAICEIPDRHDRPVRRRPATLAG